MTINVANVVAAKALKMVEETRKLRPRIPNEGLPDAEEIREYSDRVFEAKVWSNVTKWLASRTWNDLQQLGFTVPENHKGHFSNVKWLAPE